MFGANTVCTKKEIEWAYQELGPLILDTLSNSGKEMNIDEIAQALSCHINLKDYYLCAMTLGHLTQINQLKQRTINDRVYYSTILSNICETCKHEIKERGLFHTTYIGCMC